jgi:hypothetical protein
MGQREKLHGQGKSAEHHSTSGGGTVVQYNLKTFSRMPHDLLKPSPFSTRDAAPEFAFTLKEDDFNLGMDQ